MNSDMKFGLWLIGIICTAIVSIAAIIATCSLYSGAKNREQYQQCLNIQKERQEVIYCSAPR